MLTYRESSYTEPVSSSYIFFVTCVAMLTEKIACICGTYYTYTITHSEEISNSQILVSQ